MNNCNCQNGYSAYAQTLIRKWYGHDIPTIIKNDTWAYAPGYSHLSAWAYNLEQCDIDALWDAKRLQPYFESKPEPETVNRLLQNPIEAYHCGMIIREAMFCCVKARCEAAGQPLTCDCEA